MIATPQARASNIRVRVFMRRRGYGRETFAKHRSAVTASSIAERHRYGDARVPTCAPRSSLRRCSLRAAAAADADVASVAAAPAPTSAPAATAAHRHRRRPGRHRGARRTPVHGTARRRRRDRARRLRRPTRAAVVLGAVVKHLQSRSSLGRGSSTTVGRSGRVRRRRLERHGGSVPGVHRQVRPVVPTDQRRDRRRLRPVRGADPAGVRHHPPRRRGADALRRRRRAAARFADQRRAGLTALRSRRALSRRIRRRDRRSSARRSPGRRTRCTSSDPRSTRGARSRSAVRTR